MIRPLDMQVAFNAVPEVARQTGLEQAAVVYRQVQDLGRAREENLVRHERVQQAEGRADVVFRPVQSHYQEGRSGQRFDRRSEEERREAFSRERRILPYVPAGRTAFARALHEEASGLALDLTA